MKDETQEGDRHSLTPHHRVRTFLYPSSFILHAFSSGQPGSTLVSASSFLEYSFEPTQRLTRAKTASSTRTGANAPVRSATEFLRAGDAGSRAPLASLP